MAYYRSVGEVPPKRHTRHVGADGHQRYEELLGQEGFSADSSLLYHRHVPAAVVSTRPATPPEHHLEPHLPLRARHLRPSRLFAASGAATDVVTGRRLLLGNDDVRLSYVVADAVSPLTRNAVGDELVHVEAGAGVLETALGAIEIRAGDHVLVPRSVVHRWVPAAGAPMRCLVVEASGHIGPPARYRSATGQFLEHAPYCERDLRAPVEPLLMDGDDVEVLVRHRTHDGALAATLTTYARHPFDVVGWDGCCYPVALAVSDFEPITGRIHQPPPVHQVFEGPGFVVCNFVPRKVDYHPLAIPVPYFHANVDSDEVMFYCGGTYEARRGSGIELGSLTLHPAGVVHGPDPQAYRHSTGIERFEETAVMVDTFRPLGLGAAALAADDPRYEGSWARADARVAGTGPPA